MYGYLFAILGSLLLVGILAALMASGAFRSGKSPREDIKRGTTYAEPLEEEIDTSQAEEVDGSTPPPPATPKKKPPS
ncbi:MAG: hypothetical protein ACLFSZ_09040 [Puniceicoccaceae bacterium]